MKRVLHVIYSMDRGGAETFIMNLYRSIDRSQIQFDFLVHTAEESAYDQEILALGGKIYRLPSRRDGFAKNKKALIKFFNEHPEYQVVHQHVSSMSYITPLQIAKKNKVPTRIIHSHNTEEKGIFHKFFHYYNRMFSSKVANYHLACSDLAAKWLFGEKEYEKHNYRLIKNGINLDQFLYQNEKRVKLHEEFKIQDKKVIGHIGRFAHQKNHTFLIDIFDELHKINPNTLLLLVGEGLLFEEMKAKVKSLNLQEHVIFTGVRADTNSFYSAMDVFLFPSLHEGLPLVLVEAQASNLPCVVADTISKQVKLTDKIDFLPLEKSAVQWAVEINNVELKNRTVSIEDSAKLMEYDINKVKAGLLEIYMK